MAFAGLRGTGDWATDQRPKNFRETILWRDPNGQAPMTALMAKMKTEKTNDPEFNWWEEELNLVRLTSDSTGLSASSTSLGLVSGGLSLVVGDVLLVEKTDQATYDNEIMLVSSITNDTAIVVKRGQAGSSAATTGTSFTMTKIGSAFEEGSTSPEATNRNPTKVTNYCQIFKTAYEMSNTAKNTKTRTGDALKEDKKRRMFDHSVSLELAWMFGQAYETTGANGKPVRYTGGLRDFISTNKTVFTTSPTEDTLLTALYPVFDYNTGGGAGNERIVFAGNLFLNNLNKLARDSGSTRINFNGTVSAYGMKLQEWIIPQGTLYIKSHPLLNTHGRYKASAFVIDPSNIIYRPLEGRDTKGMDNIQANDEDTTKGQWLTEAGIEVRHEKTMAYIGNFII